jgi:DNA-binding transcriptional regulator YiaG
MTPRHIKTIRAWFQLTQAQLAERLGVQTATVGRWEIGMVEPNGPSTGKLIALWAKLRAEVC